MTRIRPAATATWQRIRSATLVVIALVATSEMALAQEFEKVKEMPTQNVPAERFVAIAYGIIWLAILVYVVMVASGVKRANDEITDLKRKLDRRQP